ncbi:MAG TPA: hypothetical protein VF096_01995 [Azonexus sp.]
MKRLCLTVLCALLAPLAWGHGGHAGKVPDDMPDAQKIRFCERVRDHAIQALYNRDRGSPMVLYEEDGSHGPRIVNHIIRRIYEEPQISSPKKAEAFGRATCHEMMGAQGAN